MRYLIGNWKSYHTVTETLTWLSQFIAEKPRLSHDLKVIICAPFTVLSEANRFLATHNLDLSLAAQDVSPYEEGRHTGEVNAKMLSELTHFCLIGHSERRHQFAETSASVAAKAARLLEYGLTPIICLDEPYLEEQVKLLLKENLPLEKCLFVYEPVAAIGSGQVADEFQIELICQKINFLTASRCPVLYGGSVDAQNVARLTSLPNVNGVLVGGESLTASHFAKLLVNLTYGI